MMSRALLLMLIAVAGLVTAQSTKSAPEPSPQDKKFAEALMDVRKLASAQQYEEALEKLRGAEALKPDSPIIQNARGSIYTSMKDYEKARECFKAADALKPGAFESRFNLTELEYVQGNYEAAAASFTEILTTFPNLQKEIRSLVQFKIVVCEIKLNHIVQADQLVQRFAFADESLAGLFTKASFAANKGDNATANELLAKAQKAFNPGQIAPYVDALVEAHWITIRKAEGAKK
jgi:tetratricopeptide (TPR) repeat protein